MSDNAVGLPTPEPAGDAPVGTVLLFAGEPDSSWLHSQGWLACDGREVSRGTYKELFEVIGTYWGSGDGRDTFNLPDLRGRFLRGVDGGAGRDPNAIDRKACNPGGNTGDKVGTIQDDELGRHRHKWPGYWRTHAGVSGGVHSRAEKRIPTDPLTDATDDVGAEETRPKNAYLNFIVKYRGQA